MPTRRLALKLGFAVLVVIAVALIVVKLRDPWPVRAFERIELGMNLNEVNGVVGLPPGKYFTRKTGLELGRGTLSGPFGFKSREAGLQEADLLPGSTKKIWAWTDYWLHVTFDPEGAVVRTELFEVHGWPESSFGFLDSLRDLFGL